MQKQQPYQSYLLRCWLVQSGDGDQPPVWRFALRDIVAEPTEHGFSDLAELNTFIAAVLDGRLEQFLEKERS